MGLRGDFAEDCKLKMKLDIALILDDLKFKIEHLAKSLNQFFLSYFLCLYNTLKTISPKTIIFIGPQLKALLC